MFSLDFTLPRTVACTDRITLKSIVQNDLTDMKLAVELDLGNNMDALDSNNLVMTHESIKGYQTVVE